MSSKSEADKALLRRFEPIVRFTKGELFYPMDVEPYVKECSLWVQKSNQEAECLVSDGDLTIDKLTQPQSDDFETVYFLKFIEEHDLEKLGVNAFSGSSTRKNGFHPGRGRLARVGYSARFIDVLFAITLLARGRVPGDSAIGAYLEYKRMIAQREHHSYYGRVVQQGDWIVLQYWFFYAFNNWRSGFSGVNDHESDWEMICIYLYETDEGDVQPEWAAYASHDFHGDDLRRRWDDPELEKLGEHPVVYAGAGSHACYFKRGEYMNEFTLPFLTPLVRLVDQQQRFWRRILKQYQPEELQSRQKPTFNLFRVPFIDYARGDGMAIGPGQEKTWDEPRLLDPSPAWLLDYRGLWGLYTRDPVSGEDAPGGPKYNRDGSVRSAWHDPVGWAGLNKVPPPNKMLTLTQERYTEVAAQKDKTNQSITEKQNRLTSLYVEAAAMQGMPHLKKLHQTVMDEIEELSAEVARLQEQRAGYQEILETIEKHLPQLEAGNRGPMRAHIKHKLEPISEVELRYGRLAEVWASLSIGLMLMSFVGLVLFASLTQVVLGMLTIVGLMVFVEAAFRKQLQGLVSGITNSLAIIAALVLLFRYLLEIMAGVVLLAGGYILWQNLREFRG